MSDQAPEQSLSIEDRFAAAFAPEEEEQEQEAAPQDNVEEAEEAEEVETPDDEESEEQVETEEETEEPDLVEIEVDGQQYQVPKALEDKFMLQADYTRKTQEVAEQRKSVELAQTQLQQAAQFQQQQLAEYAELLNIDKQLQQYANIDWNALIDSDPVEAMRLSQARTDLKEARAGLTTQLTQKYEQQYYQNIENQKKLAEEGYQALLKDIPNWNKDLGKELSRFAVEKFGFTKAEMDAVYDPRYVKVLHAAYQLSKQTSNKPLTDKKVANLPKVSKPGSVSKQSVMQSRESDARKALKKTGSMDAAQAVFLSRYSK